jgi:hypothetical protein
MMLAPFFTGRKLRMETLHAWEAFCLIVGGASAALTGLQFVVIALVAEARSARSLKEIDAFGTPTIVHFSAVLLISAILTAPWRRLSAVAVSLAICGLAGVAYSGIVLYRARRQTGYKPVFEDWLFHTALPFVAYGLLAIAAFDLLRNTEAALFAIAAATLLLLFIGIHNAWDTVTWIAVEHSRKSRESRDRER